LTLISEVLCRVFIIPLKLISYLIICGNEVTNSFLMNITHHSMEAVADINSSCIAHDSVVVAAHALPDYNTYYVAC